MKNDQKFIVIAVMFLIAFIVILLVSCAERKYVRSTGTKYGILQKVSHKDNGCGNYVIEVAMIGGRTDSDGETAKFNNAQSFDISKRAYDTLQNYLGDGVVLQYEDMPYQDCGEDKKVLNIRIKK